MSDLLTDVLNFVEKQEDIDFQKSANLDTEEKRRAFTIETDEQADRVMSWLLNRQMQVRKNSEAAKEARERLMSHVDQWEHSMNSSLIASCQYFTTLLEVYTTKKLENKKGSIKLLNGTLKLSQPKAKIEYDEEKTIKWLRDNGLETYIKPGVESLNKADFKKVCEEDKQKNCYLFDGKPVDGISLIPQNMAFVADVRGIKETKKVSAPAVEKDVVNPSTELPAA